MLFVNTILFKHILMILIGTKAQVCQAIKNKTAHTISLPYALPTNLLIL